MLVSSLSLDCVSITKVRLNYKILCSSKKPLKAVGMFEEAVHKSNRTIFFIILSHAFFYSECGEAEVFHLEIITLLSSLFTSR